MGQHSSESHFLEYIPIESDKQCFKRRWLEEKEMNHLRGCLTKLHSIKNKVTCSQENLM